MHDIHGRGDPACYDERSGSGHRGASRPARDVAFAPSDLTVCLVRPGDARRAGRVRRKPGRPPCRRVVRGGRGTTIHGTSAPAAATGTTPTTGTRIPASGWPARLHARAGGITVPPGVPRVRSGAVMMSGCGDSPPEDGASFGSRGGGRRFSLRRVGREAMD